MTQTDPPKVEEAQVVDPSLSELETLQFTKAQLIILYNVVLRQEYRLADAKVVQPIIDMIEPLVKDTKEPAHASN